MNKYKTDILRSIFVTNRRHETLIAWHFRCNCRISAEYLMEDFVKDYYTRSTGLIGYPDFIKNLGGDIIPLLEEVGLDPGLLRQDDGYYSYNKGVMFLDLASRTLNEPNFGLKFAKTLSPDFANFGPVAYLGFFEKNARGWINALLRYQTYHTNGQIIELIEHPEKKEGIIRVHTHAYMIASRQLIEMQMASFRMLARQVLNIPEANPRITRFQHEKPRDVSLHQEIFGRGGRIRM